MKSTLAKSIGQSHTAAAFVAASMLFGITIGKAQQVPVGMWNDRGTVIQITDAGGGTFNMKVTKPGPNSKWDTGNGRMTGSSTSAGNPNFNMGLFKNGQRIANKQNCAFNPNENLIRYQGGREGLITWTRYTDPNEIAMLQNQNANLQGQINALNNQIANLASLNAQQKSDLQRSLENLARQQALTQKQQNALNQLKNQVTAMTATGTTVQKVTYQDRGERIITAIGNKQWLEDTPTGRKTFTEIARDANSVYLLDPNRSPRVAMQIDLYQKKIFYGAAQSNGMPAFSNNSNHRQTYAITRATR